MTEKDFVKGQSDNLPKVDVFMMSEYFAKNPDFTSAEIKGVKLARSERESYGDNAIGYVQLRRDGDLCTVKAKITPEHNIKQKAYTVTAVCNEKEEEVISVRCEDCAAHLGGCKHAIAFLAWLHRRSEDPPLTSTKCYWKKSKLALVGSSLKFIKAKDMVPQPDSGLTSTESNTSFLDQVLTHGLEVGHTDCQLTKYYKEFSSVEKLSMNYLSVKILKKNISVEEFFKFCHEYLTNEACEDAFRATIEQANCPLWHELRYARVTASKAYDAAHCKTHDGALVELIMGAKLKGTAGMERGRKLEKEVLQIVEKKKNIKIRNAGIMLNKNYPIIGASPDGETAEYVVEIKCPTTKKAERRYVTNENKITAKYMGQVQIQMFFLNKKEALFCVADPKFEDNKNVTILIIKFDEQYCFNILNKCTNFWKEAIFPILLKNSNIS